MIVTVAGEQLELSAHRAAFWRAGSTLLVADPHFGKAATFRALGVFVPKGTTRENTARLDMMIHEYHPARVIFLGDFLHAAEGRNDETFDALTEWRKSHAEIEMVLVRGNHDKRAGDPPDCVGMQCVDAPMIEGPFAFAHHPVKVPGAYVLAGHIHPCVSMVARARERARLCCFWFATDVGVLPAFGEFTGCAEVSPEPADKVYVVAGDEVLMTS